MTRRGSLAYYLAAWVCGSFFIGLGLWIFAGWGRATGSSGFQGIWGFLFFCFLGLLSGACTTLLFAALVRRVVSLIPSAALWHWLLVGAGAGLAVTWGLAALGDLLEETAVDIHSSLLSLVLLLVVGGPSLVWDQQWWLPIPAGAATAALLFYIHRAFAARKESAAS
jgi:hypothetical protein